MGMECLSTDSNYQRKDRQNNPQLLNQNERTGGRPGEFWNKLISEVPEPKKKEMLKPEIKKRMNQRILFW